MISHRDLEPDGLDLFLGVIVAVRKGLVSGMCFPWQALGGGNLQGVTGDLFICFGSYAYCRGFSVSPAWDDNTCLPPMGSVITTLSKTLQNFFTAVLLTGSWFNKASCFRNRLVHFKLIK